MNIKKIMQLSSLILLLCITKNQIYAGAINTLHKGPWEFLEFMFISRPEDSLQELATTTKLWGYTGAVQAASTYAAYRGIHYAIGNIRNPILRHGTSGALAIASFLPGYLTYKVLQQIIRESIEFEHYENFVILWHIHRSFVPKNMIPALDNAHKLFKVDYAKFKEESRDIIKLIKSGIYEKFPEKYKIKIENAKNEKKFFDYKLFTSSADFDLGRTLSGIAQIITAIKH